MSKATGKQILELARQHLGQQYVFGSVAPKDDSHWDGPWDCAELVSWAVYQTSQKLYGCTENYVHPSLADAYTGAWARDARTVGHIISLDEAARTPGAAVLRVGPKVGHIVISNGAGGTVEAHSTAYGVIESTLSGRRWDFGILVPWINYEKVDAVVIEPHLTAIYRLTSPYTRGPDIERIQVALQSRGYFLARTDGVFGPKTYEAVIRFQKDRQLVVDGEVGPQTMKALGLGG